MDQGLTASVTKLIKKENILYIRKITNFNVEEKTIDSIIYIKQALMATHQISYLHDNRYMECYFWHYTLQKSLQNTISDEHYNCPTLWKTNSYHYRDK